MIKKNNDKDFFDYYWEKKSGEFEVEINQLQKECYDSLLVWSELHRELGGKPFSLKDYPFMEEIYESDAKEMCIIKSAQCSLSEYAFSLMFWFADTRGHTYFVMPTMSDAVRVVQGRLDSIADESIYIKKRLKSRKTDNTKIKRFGFNNMYFTGSQKRGDVISDPADITIQDEFDEHNPAVDLRVLQRLNNSKHKWRRKISTPTTPGKGIHAEYEKSSKAIWIHECKKCGKDIQVSGMEIKETWQDLIKLVKKVENDVDEYEYCCPYCKSTCDFLDGYWRHREDVPYKGYSINRMMTRSCTATEFMKVFEEHKKESLLDEFFMSGLGMPYEKEGTRIYEHHCQKCQLPNVNCISRKPIGTEAPYFIGMDTGSENHYAVGHLEDDGRRVIDTAGCFKTFNEIERIIDAFDPTLVIIDNMPETTKVFELWQKYGFVRGASHNNSLHMATKLKQDEESHIIYWNRFCSIERVQHLIRSEAISFPEDIQYITERNFYKHLCSQIKGKKAVNANATEFKDVFTTVTGKKVADHYLFALIYCMAAMDIHEKFGQDEPSGIFFF